MERQALTVFAERLIRTAENHAFNGNVDITLYSIFSSRSQEMRARLFLVELAFDSQL
ncbi:MAG TPA: hypothetical protein VKB05_16270 [Pyrinomonadaceae bacterium]|nr:hypothetical protein [Pyrinomonadaceae bacterium]